MRLALEWLVALAITAVALFLLLNGTLFSSWDAVHVDLSINLSAAHALRDGENPYGPSTLLERAKDLGGPTELLYSQLFTSFIQPPTSALSLLPLTTLPWRDATHLYLVLNHVFLLAAVGVTLVTVRPALPARWVIACVSVILAGFSQLNTSFSLGQVDATLLLLLAVAFWAYMRGHAAAAGTALALATAIKLIPGLLLLYFLWKREYRVVLWAAGVGAVLFFASLAYVGFDVYETYLTDTLPALSKGSTHYSNASIGALIARAHTPEVLKDLPFVFYLDEVPGDALASLASLGMTLAGLASLAAVIRRRTADTERLPETLVFEYYLVVAVALLVSSVTWEFYVIWLLPVFLVAFLAPRTLGTNPWPWLALLVVAFVALNYPGDLYLFVPNDFFFHPEWVPGVWVEDKIWLYHSHFDAILYLRLSALLLLTLTLSGIVLHRRLSDRKANEARSRLEEQPAATS